MQCLRWTLVITNGERTGIICSVKRGFVYRDSFPYNLLLSLFMVLADVDFVARFPLHYISSVFQAKSSRISAVSP